MNELIFTNAQRAEVLTQALPYIRQYSGKIVVVKYGGNAMINQELKQQVMEDIVLLWLVGVKVVLVHGGGPEINRLMERLGKEPVFVKGLRVTDQETMDIVQMVLSGKINKTLVNLLEMQGGRAMGISGIDGGLIRAEAKDPELGFVGRITGVDIRPVMDMLEKGWDGENFSEITNNLRNSDPYMVMADFKDYRRAQADVQRLYADRETWNRMSLMNIANAGIFSADRSVMDYARNIWGISPVK